LAKDNKEEMEKTDEGIEIWGHPAFSEMVFHPLLWR